LDFKDESESAVLKNNHLLIYDVWSIGSCLLFGGSYWLTPLCWST